MFGKKVKQQEAKRFIKRQEAKEDYAIKWYDYTDNNIKAVLIGSNE